jgi:hypothetical protein
MFYNHKLNSKNNKPNYYVDQGSYITNKLAPHKFHKKMQIKVNDAYIT